ncbi:FMN-binding protein [Kaarinaea lacus]
MNTAATSTPPSASSVAMITALGGIAMISGFLVVLVFQLTMPAIEENKRIAIEKAITKVLPGTVSRLNVYLSARGVSEGAEADSTLVYVGFDQNQQLVGIAAEAAAPGYQDIIRILYGYKPNCQCITGINVLTMKETPGLGDKIAKDPAFLENFKALDAKLNGNGDGLANAIKTVKHGRKVHPWQIDAISGSTVSCNAIGKMLNSSGQYLMPLVNGHLSALKQLKPSDSESQ